MARLASCWRAMATVALISLTATGSVASPPTLVQRLVAMAVAGDLLGSAVALSDDQLVLGAPGDDEIAADSGAAHVYRLLGGAWVFEQKLVASDGTAGQSFGFAAASGPDTVVVGAPLDDDGGADAGAVYVYNLVNGLWFQQQKLVADDAAAGDQLGYSVALEGGRVLAGAPMNDGAAADAGAVYTFVESVGVWVQEQKITASDAAADDQYGYSVGIVPGQAVVGAPGSDAAAADAGAAYALALVAGTWVEDQMLVGADAAAGDALGTAVSTVPSAALIGAPMSDDGAADAGAAYYYERDSGIWFERQKVQPDDPAADDHFGDSVALSGALAVVGLPGRDNGVADSGSMQLFGGNAGVFDLIEEVFSTAPTTMADFGTSVAADGANVLVGAPGSDPDDLIDLGSGWAFEFAAPTKPTGLKASTVSVDTIALSWKDGANETGIDVLRDTKGARAFEVVATLPANVTSYVDAGLATGTKHCYRVRAVNAFGATRSNRSCVRTESGAPNKPRKLRAQAVSSTQIDLTWRDRSDDEDQFVITRKAPGGGFVELGVAAANATSASDTTAAPGTKYCYRVQAENDAGLSRRSNRNCATTDP